MLKSGFALFCALLLAAGVAAAGEKKLMHCFVFTARDTATDADFQAFFKATDTLQQQTPAMSHVWYGKLQRPFGQLQPATQEEGAKLREAKPGEPVAVSVRLVRRQYGVCMDFADEAALKSYAESPAHKTWEAAYDKVRVPGTNSFDLLGQ
jgi:hypothetical protein